MRGATCAIFMMTFTPPADYQRVHRNKVPLSSGRIGLIEIISSRRSRYRSLARRVGVEWRHRRYLDWTRRRLSRIVAPCERNMACYIVGHSMMNKSAHFRKTVSATTDPPTAIPVSLFWFPQIAMLGEMSPRRRRRYKSDEQSQISSPAKTASAPYSQPDWLPPRSQTHRVTLPRKGKLLCGKFPRCIFLAADGDVLLQPKSQH
jgi:hypothetical protein